MQSRLTIQGGKRLSGTLTVSGSKNAALPLIFASLLTPEEVTLERVPHLSDIRVAFDLIRSLGGSVTYDAETHTAYIKNEALSSTTPDPQCVRQMRASVICLGPLLARCGKATLSMPGGCSLGTRPIDIHLFGLTQMGAQIEVRGDCISAYCKKPLKGASIHLPFPSVGATEHLLMTAASISETTELHNAAIEPEIMDLIVFLETLGAKITAIGPRSFMIKGSSNLKAGTHEVIPDRIEAGTFLILGALLGDPLVIEGVVRPHLEDLLQLLQQVGAGIEEDRDKISIKAFQPKAVYETLNIETAPFPGFSTDLQPQWITLLTQCDGKSSIRETIFENRFMAVPELQKLGAKIEIQGQKAIVSGPTLLRGTSVTSTDIRAAASLVIAGLLAKGTTHLSPLTHLERGYEQLAGRLRAVGASIELG